MADGTEEYVHDLAGNVPYEVADVKSVAEASATIAPSAGRVANGTDEEEQPSSQQDGIHTLYISNLPDDVTERELYLLFRVSQGYKRSLLKRQGAAQRLVAFVVFDNHRNAVTARDAVNGVVFDPQTGTILQVDLAKANSKARRSQRGEDGSFGGGGGGPPEKKLRTVTQHLGGQPVVRFSPTALGSSLAANMQYVPLNGPPMQYAPHHVPSPMYGTAPGAFQGEPPMMSPMGMGGPGQMGGSPGLGDLRGGHMGLPDMMLPPPAVGGPMAPGPGSVGGAAAGRMPSQQNPPCTTLFISNLNSECSEEELQAAFRSMVGYRKLRVQCKGGNLPVAFVEFENVACSSQAMDRFQGMPLLSALHGGLHIEFAKNKMGQPGRNNANLLPLTSSVGA